MALSKTTLLIASLALSAGIAAFARWPHNPAAQVSERYRSQVVDRGDIVQ